jgi:hypothetical protein
LDWSLGAEFCTYLQGKKIEEGLDAVKSAVHKVAQEEIAAVGHIAADLSGLGSWSVGQMSGRKGDSKRGCRREKGEE